MRSLIASLLTVLIFAPVAPAQQQPRAAATQARRAQDPNRPIPPSLPPLAADVRAAIEGNTKALGEEIAKLREELKDKPALLALIPDIQIYHNALRYPFLYDETIDAKASAAAFKAASERVAQLRAGSPEWINQSGPRGYVSRIDGSVQPYLVATPKDFRPNSDRLYRLDFFCHGRGEDLTELKFISAKTAGEAPTYPPDEGRFVIFPYGRFCNANKFAGEIDLLEVLEDVKRRYRVDQNRVVMTGFSMGGAAAWQFAVHYPDLFAAASPGAGFAESREFLRVPQTEVDAMAPWQRALWHLYDCTDYVENLSMLPTVAYVGEIDGQKQASDVMLREAAKEGVTIERLIGPKTAHKYEAETKKELEGKLARLAAAGRDPLPRVLRFTTWTLRYNKASLVKLQGLERHWDRARLTADMTLADSIQIRTANVSAFALDIPVSSGLVAEHNIRMRIDGQSPEAYTATTGKDGSLKVLFAKSGGVWRQVEKLDGLRKRPGLQGPIDDAFMDAFLIVRPAAAPLHDAVGKWVASECDHAIAAWQKQFRGEARVKGAADLTDADIRDHNLVLFGDPSSNPLIAKIADRLPIKWDKDTISVGGKSYPAANHAVAMIYPNPLNPNRYVVLNSGFTFREFDYLNNARQTPKLPDYAVIDTSVPITRQAPGKIVEAGFFDETWQLPR